MVHPIVRLGAMKDTAFRLLVAAQPVTANVLIIVRHLNEDDIEVLALGGLLSKERALQIASFTGLKPGLVADIANRILRMDLQSYASNYQAMLAYFLESGESDQRIKNFLMDSESNKVYFLLHGQPAVWDGGCGMLCDLLIEGNGADDFFYRAVEGYLVAQHLAFDSSLQVLEVSLQHRWHNWQTLWTWF